MNRSRYHRCPECGKRNAYMKIDGTDDLWVCRTSGCDWYAYAGGEDTVDVQQRQRLADANPQRNVWVTALKGD